jgi:tRNA modification GTPase
MRALVCALQNNDTIAAVATPPGMGGVGVIRVSGPKALAIGLELSRKKNILPRTAILSTFYDASGAALDQGLLLYFPAPNSFTGEEVLEIQGHGGPVVQDILLSACVNLGARLSEAGEFSKRAFLNEKLDLSQAEAVLDLITASSKEAAKAAVRSLQGDFSKTINALVDRVIRLRAYIEAAIDFPEEELDFISRGQVQSGLAELKQQLILIQTKASQGVLLQEGAQVVLAGAPNVGKSSLLNALAGRESAIVSEIPGTTRDRIQERICIDGLLLHLSDTAGIRESLDPIEQEGVRRAKIACSQASHILLLLDASSSGSVEEQAAKILDLEEYSGRISIVINKIDLAQSPSLRDAMLAMKDPKLAMPILKLSLKTEEGLPELREHLKKVLGFEQNAQTEFTARRRHLEALSKAQSHLMQTIVMFEECSGLELIAEELRWVQIALDSITGKVSADDLLGKVFSEFCIGK